MRAARAQPPPNAMTSVGSKLRQMRVAETRNYYIIHINMTTITRSILEKVYHLPALPVSCFFLVWFRAVNTRPNSSGHGEDSHAG